MAIDSQVCFHRRSFADPVKQRQSTTESMGPLMGTYKAAWGVKLLLTIVSSCKVDCGSFCALLKTQHYCLPPCGWCCPPASHPPSFSRPPPIYFIPDIARVEKTITKTSSVSCVTELVKIAIQLLYLCCEFGVPTVEHQRARVA